MLLYLGLFAVLLITSEVKYINEVSIRNNGDNYKDLDNNDIDISSFCKSRTCVLKCCPNGQDLNTEGACYDTKYGEELSLLNKYLININKWNRTEGEVKVINRKIYQNFAYLQSENFSDNYTDGFQLMEFYILKNGNLQIKPNNNAEQWFEATFLDFCVNSHFSTAMNKPEHITIIIKHANERKENADSELYRFIAGGMLVSLLLMGVIVYRMSPVLKRILGLTLMAFTFSLGASYILTAVQLFALRAGVVDSTECKIISPILYFFVLSSFFWINVMSYDTWWIIRNFRKYSTKINKEVDAEKFIRFTTYGWLIPFLITVVAEVVDILKLDLILPIIKPPFESCLVNDQQMMVYAHIPISLLIATNCTFFLMNIYNIWKLQHSYYKVIDITAIMITKGRFIHVKLFAIIGVSAALELIPNVPTAIYYSINANNILVGVALYTLFIYETCIYNTPLTRYNISEKFVNIYRKLCGTFTRRSTVSTIFMNEKSKEELQEYDCMISQNAVIDSERNRY